MKKTFSKEEAQAWVDSRVWARAHENAGPSRKVVGKIEYAR